MNGEPVKAGRGGGEYGIYEASFARAAELLRKGDAGFICGVTGARLDGARIRLEYFAEPLSVGVADADFEPPTLPPYERILVLHYLTTLGRAETKGEYSSFKNLPDASFYESTYRRRGPEKILGVFGRDPERIVAAAERLGGSRAGHGDVSVKLTVLPRVEAIVVLFRGDEEFPPDANILYRDDIVNYLPLEDVAVLSGLIASRLKRALAG